MSLYKVTLRNSYSGQSCKVRAVGVKDALAKALKDAGLHYHYDTLIIKKLGEDLK